jgi:hypothetical protein
MALVARHTHVADPCYYPMNPGAPVVDGRGGVGAGDGAKRGAGRDPGRDAVVGAVRAADDRHGAVRAPAALPHGGGVQGRRRRHDVREVLGAGRGRRRRAESAAQQGVEAVPHRARGHHLRRLPHRSQGHQVTNHLGMQHDSFVTQNKLVRLTRSTRLAI